MKKTLMHFSKVAVVMMALVIMAGCAKKDDEEKPPANAPVVKTEDVSLIGTSFAYCGGTVSDDAGSAVTARGVCWSTDPSPTIDDIKTTNGTGKGAFDSMLTGLSSGTEYHVRAYATNANGTGYGEEKTFITITSSNKFIKAKIDGSSFSASTITVASVGGKIGISGITASNILILSITENFTTGSHDMTLIGDYYGQFTVGGTSIYTSQSGNFTITEYDPLSRVMKGTFNFIAVLAGGTQTISVTDGEFQVTL